MLSKKLKNWLTLLLLPTVILGCNNSDLMDTDGEFIDLNGEAKILKADQASLSSEEQKQIQKISESLAVRYVNEQNPSETEIKTNIIDYFYNALIHFYISDLEEVKTVTEEYGLVVGTPTKVREFLVWVDLSQQWLGSWRNGEVQTGVPEIDELIDQFDLELERYREFQNTTENAVATMKSDRPLNVFAVGGMFGALPQIESAGPDGYLTGGRDIEAEVKENYLLLDVTVGSGDCPSGCINKINHTFQVAPDGEVKIIE